MSSDRPTDQNAPNQLFSQYQQASSSGQQYQQLMCAPGQAAPTSTSPSVPQGLGSLLASYRQQSNATNTTPLTGHVAQAQGLPAHQVMQQAPGNSAQGLSALQAQAQHHQQQQQVGVQPASTSNADGAALSQQILASAQLLSAINPGFAAVAIARAFDLNPQQQPQPQPQPQIQQPQQQPQVQQPQQQNQPSPQATLETIYQQLQQQASNPAGSPAAAQTLPDNSAMMPHANSAAATNSDMHHSVSAPAGRGNNVLQAHLASSGKNKPHCVAATTASCRHELPPVNLSAQNWSLEQLEAHAKQLRDSNQPVPQWIAILLASARRKQEKHNAKKLANRKSAFSSRIRKKAKIDAMAQDNKRLRREAIILSFLPDPVLAIGIDGEITFCSMQMERVLRHKAEDLIGSNIEKFILPYSRSELRRMIQDVVDAEEQANLEVDEDDAAGLNGNDDDNEGNGGNNSGGSSDPNAISLQSSEQSFPMLEVKVDSSEDVSDSSGFRLSKKPAAESAKRSSSNSGMKQNQQMQSGLHQKRVLETSRSSSSLTEKQEYQSSVSIDSSLSKTKDRPSASNLSEDSGYRESNGSQESNESSSSSVSNTDEDRAIPLRKVKRIPPLAPACNVCLIRNDLSTIWCELTSSIRTIYITDGDFDAVTWSRKQRALKDQQAAGGEMKELLLCFRPILEGDKVEEDLRFIKKVSISTPEESEKPKLSKASKSRPLKKRKFISDEEDIRSTQKKGSRKGKDKSHRGQEIV